MRLLISILWILLMMVGVGFAILNSHDLSVNYLVGQKIIYFPLLLLILLFIGVWLGIFALLPYIIKIKTQLYQLKQQIKIVEQVAKRNPRA